MNTEAQAAAKSEAIATANAHLNNAGMPTYSELIALINDAAALGLNFDIGNAYIRRTYIDAQTELQTRIKAVNAAYLSAA